VSLTMTLTRNAARLRRTALRTEEALRHSVIQPREPAPVPRGLRRRCTVESHVIDGCNVVTLRPHNVLQRAPHVVYLHGGGYVSPLKRPHWMIVNALMRRTSATITVPMYPLAPEHNVDDALAFLDALMSRIQEHHGIERMVYAADSAGGGLALAHTLRRRDAVHGLAASGLILFAPWVDITMTNPDITRIEPRDVMLTSAQLELCGRWWADHRATTDPAVSPIYADLHGLPPIHLFVGEHDLFLPDITLLHQRLHEAGTASTLTVAPGGFHVYVGAPWIPEARAALDRSAGIIGKISSQSTC
jgi:epsilon-lactone hydrolase